MVKAVIFDMDGLMFDTERLWDTLWEPACKELGLPLPPAEDYATAEMTPMARSFYAESKRVANALIKRELGVRLIYPDYRAGLAALLEAEDTPA